MAGLWFPLTWLQGGGGADEWPSFEPAAATPFHRDQVASIRRPLANGNRPFIHSANMTTSLNLDPGPNSVRIFENFVKLFFFSFFFLCVSFAKRFVLRTRWISSSNSRWSVVIRDLLLCFSSSSSHKKKNKSQFRPKIAAVYSMELRQRLLINFC